MRIETTLYFLSRITYAEDVNMKNVLETFRHTLDNSRRQQSGQFKWKVPANGVDYLTRTFVYDNHNCSTGFPFRAPAKGKYSQMFYCNL